MAKRKTTFYLDRLDGDWLQKAEARIIGQAPEYRPYLNIEAEDMKGKRLLLGIQDKDLERFAVNILKALGSSKLKK